MTDRHLTSTELKRLHRSWRKRTARPLAVILDGVMTPVNVGSVVRSSAAYGVDVLFLAGPTVAVTAPGVGKTAMGTERYLDVRTTDSGASAADAARNAGFTVVGVELTEGAVPLHELRVDGPVCIAVGHEDHGLARATLDACDHIAYLPLVGRVGSLNVAQAATVALAELRRQEWSATGSDT